MRPSYLHTSLSCLLLATVCQAQMAGAYTIDPSGSGARNFTTFAAAATSLATNGISAPVTLTVALGTWKESFALSAITGTSTTNTVSFKSSTPGNLKLTRLQASTGDLITLNAGVNNVSFEGFTFEQVNGSSVINSLYTSPNGVNDIVIRDCWFENTCVPNASYGAIRTQTTQRWKIQNCVFDVNGTAAYTQGAAQMVIANNRFNNNNFAYCLSLWNSNRSQCVVYNNVFTGKVTSALIRCSLSHYQIDFWHNTFAIETAGFLFTNSQCCTVAWNTFYNNIFVVTGTGGVFSNTGGGQFESDYNIFFVASGKIGRHGTTDYTTLASWSAAIQPIVQKGAYDSNSIAADPKLVSATDLHLTATSPGIGKALAKPVSFLTGHEVMTDLDGLLRGSKKDIGAYELTGWKSSGAGCPGTNNAVPTFEVNGNVAPGDTPTLDVANARPSSTAVLALGLQQVQIPLGGTCTLQTNPLALYFFASDANGKVSVPAAIPATAAVVGVFAYAQFGIADSSAAGGIATTNTADVKL